MTNTKLIKNLMFYILVGSLFGSIVFNTSNFINFDELLGFIGDVVESGGKKYELYDIITVFLKNIKYIVGIWFLGFISIGKNLIPFLNFAKGFSIGYTSSIFLSKYGFSGIEYILKNYTINSIISIIIIVYISYKGISFDKNIESVINYLKHFILSALGVLLASFVS